ncbi:MAG: hypothetical protein JXB33_02845 [Clostridia bacterium]|nr:hypothetical protein [Clostridia bacterium]
MKKLISVKNTEGQNRSAYERFFSGRRSFRTIEFNRHPGILHQAMAIPRE